MSFSGVADTRELGRSSRRKGRTWGGGPRPGVPQKAVELYRLDDDAAFADVGPKSWLLSRGHSERVRQADIDECRRGDGMTSDGRDEFP